MKSSISILFFITLLFTIKGYSQTDTTLQKLLKINYTVYKGHTVDSLIKALPNNYIQMKILPSHRGEYGDLLCIFYPNDDYVAIKVKSFKYFNPHLDLSKPLANQWNTALFRKETLAYTIVYAGVACQAGCENDPQSSAP